MPELYPDEVEGPYTVPSGDDVADGPKAFRDFADSMPVPQDNFTVISKTADFTPAEGEEGALFAVEPNSGTITVTLPPGLRSGYACVIAHVGSVATHDVALAPGAGVTIEDVTLLRTKQYRMTSLVHLGGDKWITCMGGIPPIEDDAKLTPTEPEPTPEPEPEPTPEPEAPAGALFSRTYTLNSDPSTEPGLVYPSTNYIKLNREDALVWQENVEEGVDILCELIPDGVPSYRRRYFNMYYYVPQSGSSKLKFYDGYDGSCPAYMDKAYRVTAYPAGQIPDNETLDGLDA